MALSHRIGTRWTVAVSAESGALDDDERRPGGRARERLRDRYDSAAAALGWRGEGIGVMLAATMLREENSMLGGRFAPFFGVAGATTLFADARTGIDLPARWSLSLSARRGWTRATGGGDAMVRTMAWDAAFTRDGLFDGRDRFGLRIAQPLRVESGGIRAWLPVEHDYASGRSEWRDTHIALTPSGREVDAELSYARPVAGGWLTLNGYARRQPGHIEGAPADLGGAIRFSLGY